MRVTLLANLRRSSRRTDKVDETSSALRLPAATHRRMTSDNHPFELEPELRPLLTCTCSPQRPIRAFGRCAGKGWLLELGGQQQLGQRFGAIRSFGRLRVEGVSSSRRRGDEPGARCRDAAVCTALVAARSSTCSGSHAGCPHRMRMLGSCPVAYSARSARINRMRMMAPRSGGAREPRSWHDLHAAHESAGKNRHVYGCTV
mgnify:CR=1 FL=1